jgi:hypothetical protein
LQSAVAELVREIADPESGAVDANDVVHEGESVVELRDGDTGVWLLRLAGPAFFVLDLDRRRVREISDPEEFDFQASWTPLVRIVHCRVGVTVDVQVASNGQLICPLDGVVDDVQSADPWLYG